MPEDQKVRVTTGTRITWIQGKTPSSGFVSHEHAPGIVIASRYGQVDAIVNLQDVYLVEEQDETTGEWSFVPTRRGQVVFDPESRDD